MEVARLFQVMPMALRKLPVSEYRTMIRYYYKVREQMEKAQSGESEEPTDGVIVE